MWFMKLVRRRAWLLVVALAFPACSSTSEPVEMPAMLQAPQLLTPMSNAYVGSIFVASSLLPTFSWAPIDGAEPPTSYELQISSDPTFAGSMITIPTTSTSAKPAIELPVSRKVPVGTRYYWRVRGCDDVACSEYSPTRMLNLGRSDHDFNGDGIADIIVGAPSYGGEALAHAYIYFGGVGATFDTDPDGTLVASAAKDFFATSVASAGDVNDDGFADVIVGAEATDGDVGAAYVYFGGPGSTFDGTPDMVLHGSSPGDHFGSSVAAAGDLDGDGFADFVVGARGADGQHGAVYAYLGGRSATPDLVTLHGSALGDSQAMYFGLAVAPVGDVDGDGYADLAVAVNGYYTVQIYFGSGTAPLEASAPLYGNRIGNIAGANDVNGDGFADIIVGDPGSASGGGKAHLYFGGPVRSNLGTLEATYAEADPGFGGSVASPGDVDGDGYADLLIGVSEHYEGSTGGVYLYFGGPKGSFGTFAYSTLIPSSATLSTWLVTSTGDVNGDGLADLVVGGTFTASIPFEGSVSIYAGGGRHAFDAPALGTLTDKLTATTGEFGQAVASLVPRAEAPMRGLLDCRFRHPTRTDDKADKGVVVALQ